MSIAKIEFAVGSLKFSGEADQTWLAEQLDKLLAKAETLASFEKTSADIPNLQKEKPGNPADRSHIASLTLVAFLQKAQATTNQIKKYVATAVWSMAKHSKEQFVTKDVTIALANSQQSRLGNPAQSLARAVKAGFVEKLPSGNYFVTPAGKRQVGLPE